ncbi:MAG TPA: hypothetical protein VHG28_17370, partial [Longimicrobiaceae bacterium]|nr:hypothetical protein [Longimicrobiaceae bacterium]
MDENAVTRWDIGIEPDGWLVEVKGNPKRGDIVEWIERSASAGTTKPGQRYLLVYSHGGGTLLKTMRRLTRIAEEAIDDFEFERLVREEALHDVGEVFARLGSSPRSLLVRMRIEQIAEESLISDIERRARGLAGSVAGERLVDRLFRQLSEAVETRGALSIREVIRRTQGEGIELQAPPVVSAEDLSGCAQDAVFLLQNCESGLPTSVLAAAIGCTVEQLEQDLSGLRAEGLVTAQGEILLLQPLPSWLTHPRKHDLLSRLLDELVTYLTSTPDPGVVRSQIQHVLTLSQRCSHSHPQVVASVFPRLDKVLKRLGDKRLVLEIADASIEAAKQPGRTRVQAEAE